MARCHEGVVAEYPAPRLLLILHFAGSSEKQTKVHPAYQLYAVKRMPSPWIYPLYFQSKGTIRAFHSGAVHLCIYI